MKFIKSNNNIECEDIMQCFYNLNDLDIKIYKYLQTNGAVKTKKIAEQIKKERSTVYRSLQRLTRCGLCKKQTKKIKTGGQYYVYKSINIYSVKNNLEKCLDNWYEEMKKTIEKL